MRTLATKVIAAENGYAVVRRLRARAPGPFANERMSHLAVRESALTESQRRLFDAVEPGIDAAQPAAAERIAAMEVNARVAILDVVDPGQVARWVVSPR